MSKAIELSGDKPTIRIFRPGTFTTMEGDQVTFSEADCLELAQSYDAAKDPAPLVVGHPRTDDPAYGWVSGLSFANGTVNATPGQVDDAFADAARKGRYRKVSASIYPRNHPGNPTPGKLYLKHIGFLGAAAPGVSGLGTVSFAGDDADCHTLSIDQEKIMPKTPTDPDAKTADFAQREADLAARERAFEEREAAAAKAAKDARHADHMSFAEGLTKAGKLKPADKPIVIGLLDVLADKSADTMSFAEGVDKTPAAALRALLEDAAPVVATGEHGKTRRGEGGQLQSFAAPAGYEVEPDQAALYSRAKALQATNPKLAWKDAVIQAQAA